MLNCLQFYNIYKIFSFYFTSIVINGLKCNQANLQFFIWKFNHDIIKRKTGKYFDNLNLMSELVNIQQLSRSGWNFFFSL